MRVSLLAVWLAVAFEVSAAPLPVDIDGLVTRAMQAQSVPGVAVGVVKDGELIYARGFGVRDVQRPERVDPDTQFAIGSITKAFTAVGLAILVDEGQLRWDDRVIDILPEFRLHDPWVTREFTVRDLLTHRSGLGPGAGDLMFVPKTDFTREEVVRALRHLKPVSSFRSEFAYDNLLYAVAGEVIAKVSGQSWEAFTESRILEHLNMEGCAVEPLRSTSTNRASPHVLQDGQLQTVPLLELPQVNPGGSILCSVNGYSRWLVVQLARGEAAALGAGRLFSEAQSAEMWTPQTLIRAGGRRQHLTQTHFTAYGLGWTLEDYRGFKRVSHNGGLPGMVSHVSLLPELDLGVIVLTNQEDPTALGAVALPILDGYVGAGPPDWLQVLREEAEARRNRQRQADADRAPPPHDRSMQVLSLESYVGDYADAWRGKATVSRDEKGLVLSFSRTEGLTGRLEPVSAGLFIARWEDRTINADAYVLFSQGFDGQIEGFRMEPVSAATDFSYDFADLDFRRLPTTP